MTKTFNRELRKLTSFNKNLCEERDSLSLFFDICENNKIRVHRQFFIQKQYREFMLSNLINIDSLNFKETINEISIGHFIELLNQLILENPKNIDEQLLFKELKKNMASISLIDSQEDTGVESILSSINNVFARYYFSINDQVFNKDDEVFEALNRVCNYNPYDYYDFKDESKPEISIDNEELSLYEFRIYNVGQANCSALIKYIDKERSDYKVIIVFDFGYKKKRKNHSLEEMINKIDENTTMVISHFHSDHINIITDHLMMHTNRWVFPDYPPASVIGNKIFSSLLKVAQSKTSSGILYKFPTPFKFSDILTIDQYSGTSKGDCYQSSLINAKSLTCKLSIGRNDILIPGDALYEEISDSLILSDHKKYDYILIPHHGCKYINNKSASPALKIRHFIGEETIGYVQCGKNSYGHANIDHLSWYSVVNYFNHSYFYNNYKNIIRIGSKEDVDYYSIAFD